MKSFRPTTPSRRHTILTPYKELLSGNLKEKPKGLVRGARKSGGRNNQGRITMRHIGGGHKTLRRSTDFTMEKRDIPGRVLGVQYDPDRSAFVALVLYVDGERRYILSHKGQKAGDMVLTSEKAPVAEGNRLPLANIPIGTFVYNVEVQPGGGGKIARSAGNFVEIVANDMGCASLKMPSSEIRKVPETCWATVGVASNDQHKLRNEGKAGRNRWKGKRPHVRGTAMNPVDHPHGGGEGRQGRGLRRAKSKWGKPTGKGQKTRTPKKYSNVFIVTRRKVGKK
ncbi:MAG: 50S ribosomal protein L2 [Candidatus Lloydbacteria bacterium RIFCSPHIGHO2_02_FULL_50_13]|uniref:Large ribosomal subunit protein uL2 n=1 Tax=Candidatus Lloydbacteria bacterium RIFCSPHIGHO2_02_FULL_50_13 TaxID=1798661 RepID=A0A1G2DDF5_9BACT|nr:MAG: 50S ribosomal protein L2 [Candidatus Lloydbacteria bacterium RIFCSPHIGHO2_02_FULL_50_13]